MTGLPLPISSWLQSQGFRQLASVIERIRWSLLVHDPMTSVLTRRRFMERVSSAMSHSEPRCSSALILLDVDGLKRANDSLGFAVGDKCLRALAEQVQVCASGCLVGRIGGDEFAVYVENPERSAALAESLRRAVQDRFTAERHQVEGTTPGFGNVLTVSVGLATSTMTVNSAESLLTAAFEAAHVAKRNGGNSVYAARLAAAA